MSEQPSRQILLCNCQRSMHVDGRAIARALGVEGELPVASELCRSQLATFEAAIAGSAGSVCVACAQEEPLFREVAAEKGSTRPLNFVDIRDRAGWGSDGAESGPKMAALLAAAAVAAEPTGLLPLVSKGTCLVYGTGQSAMDVAAELAGRMSVTLLLADPADAAPPAVARLPIYRGRIRKAAGHLGAFQIEVDGYAPVTPSSRARLEFILPRDGAKSACDLILDVSGRPALFTPEQRRDGYLRADPASPAALARAMLQAIDLVGEFEKPLYVGLDSSLCAHARSGKVGCRNCLDGCPTGAITPDGDHVAIDPAICGGCGTCSAVCPTGAVSYTYPQRRDLVARAAVLLQAYRAAGGRDPIVLLHDAKHGEAILSAMARHGGGLPARVLPLALHAVTQIGHEILAALLALGADHVVSLAAGVHAAELAGNELQMGVVSALLTGLGYAGERLHLVSERDPEQLESLLRALSAGIAPPAEPLSAAGTKRDLARTALAHLHRHAPKPAPQIALSRGAPYGRALIKSEGCTLCLSCIGACPTGALSDNPDRPQVSFTEAACVQCGICVATCPEKVITLEPRYDFTTAAIAPSVLKGDEPFLCVECGKPFGTRASIERVTERLKGHAMFQSEARLRTIQMCDTCRVVAMTSLGGDPMRGPDRPRVRTTADYIDDDGSSS